MKVPVLQILLGQGHVRVRVRENPCWIHEFKESLASFPFFTTSTTIIIRISRPLLSKSTKLELLLPRPIMPATRSSARLAAETNTAPRTPASRNAVQLGAPTATAKKRTAESSPDKPEGKKRVRKTAPATSASTSTLQTPAATGSEIPTASKLNGEDTDALVPAVLTFSLEEAKRHLINVDHRFEDIFNKMTCKPFENLEQFHPFQSVLQPCYSLLRSDLLTGHFLPLSCMYNSSQGGLWLSDPCQIQGSANLVVGCEIHHPQVQTAV